MRKPVLSFGKSGLPHYIYNEYPMISPKFFSIMYLFETRITGNFRNPPFYEPADIPLCLPGDLPKQGTGSLVTREKYAPPAVKCSTSYIWGEK